LPHRADHDLANTARNLTNRAVCADVRAKSAPVAQLLEDDCGVPQHTHGAVGAGVSAQSTRGTRGRIDIGHENLHCSGRLLGSMQKQVVVRRLDIAIRENYPQPARRGERTDVRGDQSLARAALSRSDREHERRQRCHLRPIVNS
jgi:hypothetical protein